MKFTLQIYVLATATLILGCSSTKQNVIPNKGYPPMDIRIDSVLKLMTLEEKIGQMNQYYGFWEVTGPAPKDGQAALKYEHLKKGWVGAMLNVRGVQDVRTLQKIAVEET